MTFLLSFSTGMAIEGPGFNVHDHYDFDKETMMPKTIAELRAELAAKEKQVSMLRAQRQKIMKQLAALDGEIAALGGRAVTRKPKAPKKAARKAVGRKRPGRGQPSLADVLAQVMADKGGVKVAEAGKLALSAGYKSTSSHFGNIVSQAMTTDKRFKKVSRGVYALKGGGKAAVKKSRKKVAKKASKKATTKVGRGVKKPLAQCLAEALSKPGAAMRAMELAAAVLKAGYSTQDKNFKQTVAGMLSTTDRFERVSRGVYKLAGK